MTQTSAADASITESLPLSGTEPYASSWEYLSAELLRLDLIIALEVHRQRSRKAADPLDQFKGLVLTENEISALLGTLAINRADGPIVTAADRDYLTLFEALRATEAEIERRRSASLTEGTYLSLDHLVQMFQLTRFERDCLLLCLAPEIDRKYEKLYSYLQDDVTRKKASVNLVLNLLLNTTQEKVAARAVFNSEAPLLRSRLIHMSHDSSEQATPLISRYLKLDDRLVDFLLCTRSDLPAVPLQRVRPEIAWHSTKAAPEIRDRFRTYLRAQLSKSQPADLLFYFSGAEEGAKRSIAEATATETGLNLLIVDAGKMLAGATPFNEAAWLVAREALLGSSLLCVERVDLLFVDEEKHSLLLTLIEAAQTFSRLTFLCGVQAWKPLRLPTTTTFAQVDFCKPTAQTRKELWKSSFSGNPELSDDSDLAALASKFRFGAREIEDVVSAAQNFAAWRAPDDPQITFADVYAACRNQSHHQLTSLARKIEPLYTWSDIVLPPDALAQLQEICSRVVQAERVLCEWGFGQKLSQGKGINTLFAGPSGTGKTMAAEIVANELELELYKIDLAGVVSKYIGETEKNLDRIFTTAENANAILFFDEADALFGKRSEVRDSHDRYANVEISYLLQKMEQYEGVTILATNLRGNLDEAFLRRLSFTVHFPFPDEDDRRRIWERIWPEETTLDNSVDLDFLARSFKLNGGNIKNIALAAAFRAAAEEAPVSMMHLLHSVCREYQKLGKPLSPDQLTTGSLDEIFA